MDIAALRGHDVSGTDIGPDVPIDPDIFNDKAESLIIPDRFEEEDRSEDSEMKKKSDEEYLGELQIKPPPLLQRQPQEAPSDDSFDGADLVEAVRQGREDFGVRRQEAARATFEEDVNMVPLPLPTRIPNAPLPVLRKVPRPMPHKESHADQMVRIRQVLHIAKNLRFKYRDLRNNKVSYDNKLVERFEASNEAKIFQELNDVRAERVLYFAFGIIFFIGVFAVTHAWSFVAVDSVAVHVYPKSIEAFEEEFGPLDLSGTSAGARQLFASRLRAFRGTNLRNTTVM
jgi:hypothetical protein